MRNEREQPMPVSGEAIVGDHLLAEIERDQDRTPEQRERLKALLGEREAKGLATYKTRLRTFNGRNALRDMREEALDFAMYADQEILQQERRAAQALECHRVLMRIAALGATLDIPEVEAVASEAGRVLETWAGPHSSPGEG